MNESPILGGIHSVDDIDAADDFSKKHVPFISAERDGERVALTVEVGHAVKHPNLPDHWIDTIQVYAEMAPIATFNFAAGVVEPKITVLAALDPGTKVMVSGRCNLHGVWIAETTV